MTTAAAFIDDKGGSAELARVIGCDPAAVRMWKHRERIPRDAWPELIQLVPGVTLETLLDLEKAASAAREAAA